MKYLGGKSRIAKQIGAFLNSVIEQNNIEKYIEPFCGAGWVLKEIKAPIRVACDVHPDLILMWKELQNGWIPPETVSEQEYQQIKNKESSYLRGFIGFGCSWGGKWFGGFARNYSGPFDPNQKRQQFLAAESSRSLVKKIKNLKDVFFKNCSYLDIPKDIKGRLIYCDPPYANTTGYNCGTFDSEKFWQWCREMSINNYVYISEYTAPLDFAAVLQIETKTDMRNVKNEQSNRVEKLFKYNP